MFKAKNGESVQEAMFRNSAEGNIHHLRMQHVPLDPCISLDGIERRFLPFPVEIRAAQREGSIGTLAGYAAKYNSLSVDLGGWVERIAVGAFRSVIGDDVRCLRNHFDDAILGRTSSGTLSLSEDATGLAFTCDLPDTSAGRDTAESVRRGDITGCSFQFTVNPEDIEWDFDAPMPLRTILKFSHLYDVGPVTFPAYQSTEVDLRSFREARDAFDALRAASALNVRRSVSSAKARLRLAKAIHLGG